MAGPSTEDKAEDIGWNILTGIPGVGTAVAGGKALGYDLPGVLWPESKEQQQQSMRDLASDGLSAVPLVGTIDSFAGIGYDILAPDDTWGNLTNQLMGGKDQYPATPSPDDYSPSPNSVPAGPDPLPGTQDPDTATA